jgi:hypothetical protein
MRGLEGRRPTVHEQLQGHLTVATGVGGVGEADIVLRVG